MRSGPAVLLAVLAVLLVGPPGASAAIVAQEGIRGVKLDMPVAAVRATLGKPTRFRTVRNEILGKVREWRYGLTVVTFSSTAADATVVSIETRSRAEQTAAGVGVGSTRATVQRKVPDARCLVEFSYDHCFVGAWRAGQVVTDFAVDRRGRVSRVVVGRVLD
jgi:hypothetical protein